MLNEKLTKNKRKRINTDNWSFGIEIEADFHNQQTVDMLVDRFDAVVTEYYHGADDFKGIRWVMEKDSSIHGELALEFVSPVLSLEELIESMKFIFSHISTNDTMGLHVSMSHKHMGIEKFDWLKYILFFEDGYIYNKFPSRVNNGYAKSMKVFFTKIMSDYDLSDLLNSPLDKELQNKCRAEMDDKADKFFGVNLLKIDDGYIEFRYLGGANYNLEVDAIISTIYMFLYAFEQTVNSNNLIEYHNKLSRMLKEAIGMEEFADNIIQNIHSENPVSVYDFMSDDKVEILVEYICSNMGLGVINRITKAVSNMGSSNSKKEFIYNEVIKYVKSNYVELKASKPDTKFLLNSELDDSLPQEGINLLINYHTEIELNKLNINKYQKNNLRGWILDSMEEYASEFVSSHLQSAKIKKQMIDLVYNTFMSHIGKPKEYKGIVDNNTFYSILGDELNKSPYPLKSIFTSKQTIMFLIDEAKKIHGKNFANVFDFIVNYIVNEIDEKIFMDFSSLDQIPILLSTIDKHFFNVMNRIIAFKIEYIFANYSSRAGVNKSIDSDKIKQVVEEQLISILDSIIGKYKSYIVYK